MKTDSDHDPQPVISDPIPELSDVDVSYEPVQDLHYTRKIRGMIVKGLAGNGIPSDPKTVGMLLSTLKDLDSSALGQMRIKSDEADQNLQAQQQALVRQFLAMSAGARPPARVKDGDSPATKPELDDSIVTREFVPGELQQGTVQNTFDEFSAGRTDVTLAATDSND